MDRPATIRRRNRTVVPADALETPTLSMLASTVSIELVDLCGAAATFALSAYFDELGQRCVELGDTNVVLDTNATLVEAIAMYETASYQPTEQYNVNRYAQRWFAKPLNEVAPG